MKNELMHADAAVRRWIEAWSDGWARHDADPIAARYTDDALFRSSPFRAVAHGPEGARAYARMAFGEEDAGMVTEHRDIWMMQAGRHPRPTGFLRVRRPR